MARFSPHRTAWTNPDVRVRTLLAAGLVLFTISLPAGAARLKTKMPGQIPKSPDLVSGYPIPFPATSDLRLRPGGLLPADLDRDGRSELVLSIPSGLVAVLEPNGSFLPGWPRTFEMLPQPAYPVGPAALGDLDGDGSSEVIACVESGNPPRRTYLYAFGLDGSDRPGWPVEVRVGGPELQRCSETGVLAADLDGDGMMEIVVGINVGRIVAYDGDGRTLPGWPILSGTDAFGNRRDFKARLSAADLDLDGAMEAICIESGFEPRLLAVSWDGRIHDGFPLAFSETVERQAPLVADLDGDGWPELIQSTLPFYGDILGGIQPAGEPGGGEPLVPAALHVLRADGSPLPGWPRVLGEGGPWGPLLSDLTGDGRPEIVQQDDEALFAFDPQGEISDGFPLTIHRDFNFTQSLVMSPWFAADLNGDAETDLLSLRSNIYQGLTFLRVFGLRSSGQSLKGFPFEIEGVQAASEPAILDVTGDGVADLVLLTKVGTNGRWELMAWDLGSLLPTSRL
jgi:hypothetical protein